MTICTIPTMPMVTRVVIALVTTVGTRAAHGLGSDMAPMLSAPDPTTSRRTHDQSLPRRDGAAVGGAVLTEAGPAVPALCFLGVFVLPGRSS